MQQDLTNIYIYYATIMKDITDVFLESWIQCHMALTLGYHGNFELHFDKLYNYCFQLVLESSILGSGSEIHIYTHSARRNEKWYDRNYK